MKRAGGIILVLIVCISCEKNVTDDFSGSDEPKLVMSAKFTALDTLQVHMSKTISMVDLDTVTVIENAMLELQTAEETYLMKHIGDGYYKFEEGLIQPGTSYKLSCTAGEFPFASASLNIPKMPEISDLSYSVDSNYLLQINFSFTDPLEAKEYYAFFLSGWKKEIQNIQYVSPDSVLIQYSNEYLIYHQDLTDSIIEYKGRLGNYSRPAMLKEIKERNQGGEIFFFSDEEINGESYRLTVEIDLFETYNDSIPELELTFQRLDKHLIEYLLSLQKYDPYPEYPIMQPVHLYSNIEGGFGLAYALSEFKYTIDVSEWYNSVDFLEKYYSRY